MAFCQPPSPLQPGDLLRVVAPSGPLRDLDVFWQGVAIWQDRGYQVEIPLGLDACWGYLAGDDDQRRHQLTLALEDPDCRGILCARGGYGSMRLLESWTWPETDPRWFIGFSDITALLWSLSQHHIAGVHGPLLTTLAAEPTWSRDRLFAWVEHHKLTPLQGKGWGQGQATGRLLPGNLAVATSLLHTPLQPDLDGVILALEDVGEAPYRIDRLLTAWRLSGTLDRLGGIALGRFSQCQTPSHTPSLTCEMVLADRLGNLGIPVVSDLPFGHDGPNAALPVGVLAHLDAQTGCLSFPSVI